MVALSIAKLRVGAESYQLSGVAKGLDDYYTGAGEAPGVWAGSGAARLGLGGEVSAEALRAVMAGLAPGMTVNPNGEQVRANPRRVPGFDLTFKIPKSASVLYAVSDDPRVQGAVIEAGNAAVEQALGWLDREAVRVRRGTNNRPWLEAKRAELGDEAVAALQARQIRTTGLVAAAFRHRTSRAGDPFLHWHVLVANMAEGVDGRWSAIVHPELYKHARAASEVFRAAFREHLTASLGVAWRPGRHTLEIAGVPDSIMGTFSKRRAEIEAWTEATGTPDDPAGNEKAALATRRSKGEQEDSEGLLERWRDEATDAGWGPVEAERVMAEAVPRIVAGFGDDVWIDRDGALVGREAWIGNVIADLTLSDTVFDRAQAVQAVAERLGDGATTATVDRVTAAVLGDDRVLRLDATAGGKVLYSTQEMVGVERSFVNALAYTDRPPAPPSLVAAVVAARSTMGEDQAHAVELATGGTSAVKTIVGPAGTGKTFALDAVREAYEAAGYQVIGAAPSARAAQELRSGAGIESSTMHSLLGRVEAGTVGFDAGSVVVVDEAGMADIRTLTSLTNAVVSAGGRVVLVGDQHQLPEVTAGGGFAYAAMHGPEVAELSVNRRQKAGWEVDALAQLRNGDVAAAVDAYLANGRVATAVSPDAVVGVAVNRWLEASHAGHRAVLQAGTNEMVDQLNAAVLAHLEAEGKVTGDARRFGGIGVRVGELVTIRTNHYDPAIGVNIINGQTGVVTRVGRATINVRDVQTGRDLSLGPRYFEGGGRLSHGYASTTHRTQGGTWDMSIMVGVDGLYREGAYVAMSRGKANNMIVATEPELVALDLYLDQSGSTRHDQGLDLDDETTELREDLIGRIGRTRGKRLAHSRDDDASDVEALTRRHTYLELIEAAARAVQLERVATDQVGVDVGPMEDRYQAAVATGSEAAVGVLVRALDRGNVGTITAVHADTLSVDVAFTSATGTTVERSFGWDHVEVIDPDAGEVVMHPDAALALAGLRREIDDAALRWRDTIVKLGSSPDDARLYAKAVTAVGERVGQKLAAETPRWLEEKLGARPHSAQGASAWDSIVGDIARYRAAHAIPTEIELLGPRPGPGGGVGEWDQLHGRVGEVAGWLLSQPGYAEPTWAVVPTRTHMVQRRGELDELFATAPADPTEVIEAIAAGQQALDLDDRPNMADAVRARNEWIRANWPHVVEAAEIDSAIAAGRVGPDIDVLLDSLDEQPVIAPALTAALDNNEAWLAVAINAVDAYGEHSHTLDDETVQWLSDVADFRAEHGVETRDPLGLPQTMTGDVLAGSRRLLRGLDELNDLHAGHPIDPLVEELRAAGIIAGPSPVEAPALEFDDTVGRDRGDDVGPEL